MKCRVCGASSIQVFSARVRDKYNVAYFRCDKCNFLQTEEPYWLEEAYRNPINASDTGLVKRNISLSREVAVILYLILGRRGKYLDYAGGYGLFTRLMRDIGFDFYWFDQNTPNILARGFEYKNVDKIDVVTSFETFEHFVYPLKEIGKAIEISSNILFTTELLPDIVPNPGSWWYYGLDHGQHVSFYTTKTLALIAAHYGLRFVTNGRIHLFTRKAVNPLLYRFLLNVPATLILKIVQNRMTSKTDEDFATIRNATHAN